MGHLVVMGKESQQNQHQAGGLLQLKFEQRKIMHIAADLAKMTLRNRLSRFLRGNKTSVPATFMTGVLLFLSSIPLCLLYLFLSAMRPLCIIVYLVILGSFFFINRSFLFWLKSQRGWIFFLQSTLFLLLDIPVVTAGIMWGVVDYMRGRHY